MDTFLGYLFLHCYNEVPEEKRMVHPVDLELKIQTQHQPERGLPQLHRLMVNGTIVAGVHSVG